MTANFHYLVIECCPAKIVLEQFVDETVSEFYSGRAQLLPSYDPDDYFNRSIGEVLVDFHYSTSACFAWFGLLAGPRWE